MRRSFKKRYLLKAISCNPIVTKNTTKFFNHLKICVQSMRNKDSSNEEQKSFNQIDKATHNTISATFSKSVFDTGSQSFIDWSIKLSLQNASHLITSFVCKAITPAKTRESNRKPSQSQLPSPSQHPNQSNNQYHSNNQKLHPNNEETMKNICFISKLWFLAITSHNNHYKAYSTL